MTVFSREEFDARLTKTRAALIERGLDGMVVSDPSNMAWLTGYDGWSFYVHQAVIITAQPGPPLWWGRGMDAQGARRTVFMGEDMIHGYDDTFVQNPDKHPMSDLAQRLADHGLSNARVGVELDNYYYSAAAHRALETSLPATQFIDATGLVNWQRAVKSPQEIEYMRRAAGIVEAMHARIIEVAEPGMRKNDLVAEIYATGITPIGNRRQVHVRHVLTGEVTQRDVDAVVIETGSSPMDAIYHDLKAQSLNHGQLNQDAMIEGRSPFDVTNPDGAFMLARIGDAVASRNMHAALYDALRVCKDF